MLKKFQVDFSNRVEILLQNLKEKLYNSSTTPFTKRVVIVPSPAMKSWLLIQIAKDESFGIAAGLEVTSLNSGITYLKKLLSEKKESEIKPTPLELALKIESTIRNALKESDGWDDIKNYLHVSDGEKIGRKSEKRLVALSDTLSHLFQQYDIYGQALLEEWKEAGAGDWQAEIWRRVVGKVDDPGKIVSKNIEIHLFSLSFLPKQQHDFLMEVAELMPVNYYLLSPCQAFWSDILSDRESRRVQKYWEMRGASEGQRLTLEEFLFDRNPLLANFGRMGREMALLVEESGVQPSERYLITQNVLDHEQYQDFIDEEFVFEKKEKSSLLEILQADMLLLRNPETDEKIDLKEDDSVQVHVANSKRREIEILYNTIMGIISADPTVSPNDIVVMAPDISEYEPYIRNSFEGKVDYQIMDLHLLTQNGIVQAFMHLLSLPFGRWDIGSILQLLEYPSFQKKMQFTLDDIYHIKKWMKECGVLWGMDRGHREQLLKTSHCESGIVGEDSSGTWEHGIDRLLYGMVMDGTDDLSQQVDLEVIPCKRISFTQGELLGRWIAFLNSLKEDLKRISDGSRYPLNEWTLYLKEICEEYFADCDQNESDSREILYSQIDTFCSGDAVQGTFSYQSIKYHLEASLNRERVCYREPHLQAIRFCSMLPMRTLPSKVIVLLGMNEGAFPRQDKTISLNALKTCPEADYCPVQTDFDRSLFLEILLSVRENLIMSYVGYSKTDGKEQPPSLVVTELMEYLDRSYRVSGKDPSEACIFRHPFRGYDHRYFDGTMKCYSNEFYKMAETLYLKEKSPNHSFVSKIVSENTLEREEDLVIDLKLLDGAARNPIKSYLNRSLKMYIEREGDERLQVDEDFILSPLNKYGIKKALLKTSLEDVLSVVKKEGKLPHGLFHELSVKKLSDESNELMKCLDQFGVNRDEIFEVELSELVDQPVQVSSHLWKVPPVEINYNNRFKVKIIGKLPEISLKGYLGWVKCDRSDVVKVWPSFLVYNILSDRGDLPLEKNLIFLKSGKMKSSYFADPEKKLEEFLDYYFKSMETASPLIPEWVPDMVYGDHESFEKKMKSSLSAQARFFYNDDLKWTMNQENIPDATLLCANWKSTAEMLYSDLYKNWFGAKK